MNFPRMEFEMIIKESFKYIERQVGHEETAID